MILVVPRRTSQTPERAYVGQPPVLALPENDVVHISCVFTWDIDETERLRRAWAKCFDVVCVGGPAYGDRGGEFFAGEYVKHGITFTSRGCPRNCGWCHVRTPFHELEHVEPGWIVQDDNILAASKPHFRRVCAMLNMMRKGATFSGGLDARLLTDWHVKKLEGLRIRELWFACDCEASIKPLEKILPKLTAWPRTKKRCYTMIGYNGESLANAEARMEAVWDMGFLPFAQLYQPEKRLEYDKAWTSLSRKWSRPAATKAAHEDCNDKKK